MKTYIRLSIHAVWICVIFNIAWTFDLFPINLSVKDQCVNLCQSEKLPILEPDNFESIVCQSGCRFFNIIKISRGFDINPAIRHCHITCNESYSFPKERKVCTTGCELIASKTEIDAEFLIQSDEEKAKNELVLGEPDSDLLETELLSDPSIKNQLEIGLNVDYKIPETHIRTMPIEGNLEINKHTSGDWLDCASKNSGIPRWILLSIMLGTVIVAIWLTLSIESRRGVEDIEEGIILDVPNDVSLLEDYIIEKDCSIFEKDYFFNNTAFIPPPKYSEINDSLPPNYSDVIKSTNNV
ncbi:hypothetical protein GWI33_016776 [Rhynchophorus ferrugineus]|uniref:Transmembrane protein 59-like n=2 Tax=Rhynchophorus ferrugineus TaxID=354439 RepID=A0A834M6T4_RHYFE|nr:hypothetical protein GWI33_016776 [Rhynchophorus ferrugineus]